MSVLRLRSPSWFGDPHMRSQDALSGAVASTVRTRSAAYPASASSRLAPLDPWHLGGCATVADVKGIDLHRAGILREILRSCDVSREAPDTLSVA